MSAPAPASRAGFLTPLEGVLARTGRWLQRRLLTPEYPLTAVEVRSRSLGVVRLTRERGRPSLAAAACLELPEGAIRLSMVEPNLADRATFLSTLRSALERAGALNAGRVCLVLPDPVARLAIVPSSELPGRRRSEVAEVLRFRLRKSLPFDVRDVHLSWMGLAGTGLTLVGAISRTVLDEYEAAFWDLGLHAGLVELAGLALHDSVVRGAAPADRVLVNWDSEYVSVLLSRGRVPVLIRTLTGEVSALPEEVAREVTSTVLYYRERLGGTGLASAAVRRAGGSVEEAVAALTEPLGLAPTVLDPWGELNGAASRPEAAQSLAGAMASVLGRAA